MVFEGDSLKIRCRAPRIAVSDPRESEDLSGKAHVFWGFSDKIVEPTSTENIIFQDPTAVFTSIITETKHLADSGLLDSILHIPSLMKNHTGMWDCRLKSQQANTSRNISIVVLSDKTKYCDPTRTNNNKGLYHWPKTIRGKTFNLPCAGEGSTNVYASYSCNTSGIWYGLDTSQCPFVLESTRILEQFSKVNLSMPRGSILESAKGLRNYTFVDENVIKSRKFRDPIDLNFISKTIDNFLEYLTSNEKELGTILLDILSQILLLPYDLFQRSQLINGTCNKFVNSAENIVKLSGITAQKQSNNSSENLSLEYFKISTASFSGITCSWIRNENNHKSFYCNTIKTQSFGFHEKNIDALIQFPNTLFSESGSLKEQISTQTLLVSVFKNSNFFPQNLTSPKNFRITSCVIGAKLSDRVINSNLTDPVFVMLRPLPFHHPISKPRPVWWNTELNGGLGGWSSQGCHVPQLNNEIMVFSCNRLGYYALIQNTRYLNDFEDENAGARFRYSQPAIYVGSGVLFITMWINIVTYIIYGRAIHMARRTKHAYVNMCLAISILTVVFTLGIYQTEDHKLCQGFGIAIHYFTLCVILWMCVNVSNMYKRMSKSYHNIGLQNDELGGKEVVGKRPILGLYLVGWGIAMIICGISGAVHIHEYASYSYCFIKNGPALSAVIFPIMIFILFLLIMFLCIKCHLRHGGGNGHLSEGTQATENVDLDLLDSTLPNNNELMCQSISISTPTTSTNIDDTEHSLSAQLKSHITILILYLTMWIMAAISIATPFSDKILYEEEVFSIIYAFLALSLGAYITYFYGVSRRDVRYQYGGMFSYLRCCKGHEKYCNPKSAVIKQSVTGPIVTYHHSNVGGGVGVGGTLRSVSRSNSQNSKNRPHSRNEDVGSVAILARNESPNGAVSINGNKVNLVLLHRQQFVHNSVLGTNDTNPTEVFYNPNQINVARKFFRKQKRLAKQNNFEMLKQRGDFDSDTSSIISYPTSKPKVASIISGGSKVNNTNIHVDRKINPMNKDVKQMNPNILSDSCNESDLILDQERFILGSDSLRAYASGHRVKVNNVDSQVVANIYTNVSETGKPEHEIVTYRTEDNPFREGILGDLNEEDETEENNLNKPIEKSNAPHYVNENYRNNIECSPQKSLTLSNVAMNTCGLPLVVDASPRDDSNQDYELKLEEEYISTPLEISANLPLIQKRAKSLELIQKKVQKSIDSQFKSISCNNVQQQDLLNEVNLLPHHSNGQSSPILFSPSLCDINDHSSPSISISSHPHKNHPTYLNPFNHGANFISTPNGSEINVNLFPSQRLHLNSSPTSESDINYQNSELSIRSHGLYAPPPNDTDLDMTLTIDGQIKYPYHSSEISDDDDANNVNNIDNIYNCSRDSLLQAHHQNGISHDEDDADDDANETEEDILNESQSSIDELYQQITRRKVRDIDISNRLAGSRAGITSSSCNNYFVDHDAAEESSQSSVVVSYVEPMLKHDKT